MRARNLLYLRWSLTGLLVGLALAGTLPAQTTVRGLPAQRETERFGLERAWFTQLALGRFSGEIVNVFEYVSPTEARYIAEVVWPQGRQRFLDSQLDAFNRALGREGAKAAADELVERLKRQEIEARVVEHTIPLITLYITTSNGSVQAVDAESGQILWTTTVGSAYHPTLACSASDKYVAVINGTVLYVMDRPTGRVLWSQSTRGIPGAGPALSNTYVFVPTLDGSLDVYTAADPTVPLIRYRATARCQIQPLVTPNSVCWPTDAGHLYVAWANRPGQRYRIETDKPIVCQPAYADGKLYVASLDGYLYCIQENSGLVLWSLSTGDPISSTPVVLGETVFVVTDTSMLWAVKADSGDLLPGASDIRKLLAVSSERIYCSGKHGEIAILARDSRAPLATFLAPDLTFRPVNGATDRLYLANQHGLLMCLREVGRDFPEIHVNLQERSEAEKAKEEAEKEQRQQPAPRGAPPMPMDPDADPFDPFDAGADPVADPFGGGTTADDADPFGGGAMPGADPMDDPFGGGAPADDDPFGAPPAGGNPFE